MIIACLGLFGLAAFTAERRTKEIGIRKVLGARTRDIVRLLAWQFSKPVIIANLIAWPVAWWVMRDWLNDVRRAHRPRAGAVRAGRAARSGDRDRHHRRPRLQGRPRQSDPRAPLRMRTAEGEGMWRNYLTVGIRALAKNRTYAFINIFGLAIGMAACLMILLYVRYEISYDRWLPDSERIFQVQSWYKIARDRPGSQAADDALSRRASRSRQDFPQIEREVYVADQRARSSSSDGQATSTEDYLCVDGNFLDVVPLADASAAIAQRRCRRSMRAVITQ